LNDGQRTLGVTIGAVEVVDETDKTELELELDDTLDGDVTTELELLELDVDDTLDVDVTTELELLELKLELDDTLDGDVTTEVELDNTLDEEVTTLLELLEAVEEASEDELDVTQPLICRAPQTPELAFAAPTEDFK
jgi:hypothetical protein